MLGKGRPSLDSARIRAVICRRMRTFFAAVCRRPRPAFAAAGAAPRPRRACRRSRNTSTRSAPCRRASCRAIPTAAWCRARSMCAAPAACASSTIAPSQLKIVADGSQVTMWDPRQPRFRPVADRLDRRLVPGQGAVVAVAATSRSRSSSGARRPAGRSPWCQTPQAAGRQGDRPLVGKPDAAARLDDHRQSRQQGHVALTDLKTGMQLADSLFKYERAATPARLWRGGRPQLHDSGVGTSLTHERTDRAGLDRGRCGALRRNLRPSCAARHGLLRGRSARPRRDEEAPRRRARSRPAASGGRARRPGRWAMPMPATGGRGRPTNSRSRIRSTSTRTRSGRASARRCCRC